MILTLNIKTLLEGDVIGHPFRRIEKREKQGESNAPYWLQEHSLRSMVPVPVATAIGIIEKFMPIPKLGVIFGDVYLIGAQKAVRNDEGEVIECALITIAYVFPDKGYIETFEI